MAEFTFAPLTPASFLDRAAAVFADRTAIIDGERRFTYRDMSGRCRRLAGALAAQGVGRGDRVAALCTNSHVMLELHHAVPMLGAALVTLNTRLSADEMAALLSHSGASVLVATHEFADRARHLAGRAGLPCFIAGGPADSYEDWIAGADEAVPAMVDERQLLAINYTSGTTGRPKGVMYHHRGRDVPANGETIGEIAVAGNDVMLGYYRDEQATKEVTRSGCFLTGDLAVMHPDGYVEIRDRSKDIIISGGENIASVEVEQVLDSHPAVIESAVVGMPHQRWGEVPVAFVTLRKQDVDAAALTEYARERLARYKVPKRFEFGELPKTSTGKIQKTILRGRLTELAGNP